MKKSAIIGFLAVCLVIFGWAILGMSSSRALAQVAEETPTATVDTLRGLRYHAIPVDL